MVKRVETSRAPQAIGPYSQAIRVGNMLFTSGQIPLTPEGKMVEGSIEDQTRQVLANLKAVLDAEEFPLESVVKATIFLKDMNDFPKVNEIYGEFFGEHRPARSTVQVAALPKNAGIEIELIAVKE